MAGGAAAGGEGAAGGGRSPFLFRRRLWIPRAAPLRRVAPVSKTVPAEFRGKRSLAKLYFSYSAMNAGKSTLLLQASWNYRERGMDTLLFVSSIDTRTRAGEIASRIGIRAEAETFGRQDDLFNLVKARSAGRNIACVFIDEAQWMNEEQVWQLARVADELRLPVMCYGLRTDFQAKLFPGSAALLAIADELREVRTICWCGKKATMVVRLGPDGKPVEEGEQIFVGGNESYVSLCRKHWRERTIAPPAGPGSGRGGGA
jgi:thymidine kinase